MKKKMYKISLLLNGILILLLLGLVAKTNKKKEEKNENPKIIFFGDSLIKRANWNKILERQDIKNSGFPGLTTSHLRWLINEHVLDYQPKICLLEGGINDIGVGIQLDRIKTNFKILIDTLQANNIIPIVQSTLYQVNKPETKAIVDSINIFLSDHCQKKSIHFLNINSKLSTDNSLKLEYSIDGTHINDKAYLIWGNEIKKVLQEIEKPKKRPAKVK